MKKSTVTVLLMLGLLLYAVVSFTAAAKELNAAQEMTAQLTEEIENAEAENERLQQEAASLGTDESLKAFAEDFFGLTDPDKVVFTDSSS